MTLTDSEQPALSKSLTYLQEFTSHWISCEECTPPGQLMSDAVYQAMAHRLARLDELH